MFHHCKVVSHVHYSSSFLRYVYMFAIVPCFIRFQHIPSRSVMFFIFVLLHEFTTSRFCMSPSQAIIVFSGFHFFNFLIFSGCRNMQRFTRLVCSFLPQRRNAKMLQGCTCSNLRPSFANGEVLAPLPPLRRLLTKQMWASS